MITRWITRLSDFIFKFLFRFRFRYDIFISYARRDGRDYALKLRDQLQGLDFSCFLDLDELPVGSSLSRDIKRNLNRSASLVLVGSERALHHSPYVSQEVEHFFSTGRTVIPVDFGFTTASGITSEIAHPAREFILRNDLTWIDEKKEALASGAPSLIVADSIDKLFKYTRRNTRVRGQWIAIGIFILLGSAISLWQIQKKVSALGKATAEATRQRTLADQATAEALRKGKEAELAAADAKRQETLALASAEEARRQQAIAEERRSVARSQELAANANAQLANDPELSLLLAVEAVQTAPTAEAENALRQALGDSLVRVTRPGASRNQTHAAFSADGELIVTAGADGMAQVWRAGDGGLLASIKNGRSALTQALFSPDGQLVLISDKVGVVRVWALKGAGREPALKYEINAADYRVEHVAFSTDGKTVLTANGEGKVRAWDAREGQLLSASPAVIRVQAPSFSPDAKYLVVAGAGGPKTEANVIEVASGRRLGTFGSAGYASSRPVFSPDGQYLATSVDWHGTIWRVADLQKVFSTAAGTASTNEPLPIQGTAVIARLNEHTRDIIEMAFSGDGRFLVTASADYTARVWDTRRGTALAVLRGHNDIVTSVAVSPDGRFVVTTGNDGTTRVWALSKLSALVEAPGRAGGLKPQSLSADGKLLAVPGAGATVRLWDTADGKMREKFDAPVDSPQGALLGAVFSPDGQHLLVARSGEVLLILDRQARRWVGKITRPEAGLDFDVRRAAFTHDGKFVVLVNKDGKMRFWKLASKSFSSQPPAPLRVASNQFSADGRLLGLWMSAPDIKIVDPADPSRVRTPPNRPFNFPVTSLAVRADGKAVVATSWDRALVWNLDDDRIIPLFGHNGFVNAGVFSPDGRWIATTGADSTTRVWEASSGRCLLEFSTPLVHPEAVAFSPDGKFIVVGSDNSAGIFACDICGSLEDLLKLANKRITRPLSLNEKQRFLGVSYSN